MKPSVGSWVNGLAEWTEGRLKAVQRWVNGRFWKYVPFDRYDPSAKTDRRAANNADLFSGAA